MIKPIPLWALLCSVHITNDRNVPHPLVPTLLWRSALYPAIWSRSRHNAYHN